MDNVRRYLQEVQHTLAALPLEHIYNIVDVLWDANYAGRTVFTLGNGGSAATASHFACDLGKGTITPGHPRFRVIALTDNVPLMTAWSNDASYEDVFVEQLKSLMRRGDVVLAISGSGNSPNVLRAVEFAQSLDGITIGFSGFGGGQLSTLVDAPVVTQNDCMEQIEDIHIILCHLIATVLRERMRESKAPVLSTSDTSKVVHAAELADSTAASVCNARE